MMDRSAIQKLLDAMPWPEGKKPTMKYQSDGRTFAVLLHESVSNGWQDIAQATEMTPEGALRGAVEGWLKAKKPKNTPAFYAVLKRTWN